AAPLETRPVPGRDPDLLMYRRMRLLRRRRPRRGRNQDRGQSRRDRRRGGGRSAGDGGWGRLVFCCRMFFVESNTHKKYSNKTMKTNPHEIFSRHLSYPASQSIAYMNFQTDLIRILFRRRLVLLRNDYPILSRIGRNLGGLRRIRARIGRRVTP